MKNWRVVERRRDGSRFEYERGLDEIEAKQLVKELNASNWYRGSEYYARPEE